MRNRVLAWGSIAASIMITFGALSVGAQTSASGPYYAVPSWDQKLGVSTRFIVLSNWDGAAVLDRETGLVWERSPSNVPAVWHEALTHCANKTVGGRRGWRLPSFPELASLTDPSVPPGPVLPAGHPFTTVQSSIYWTATTSSTLTNGAWLVSLHSGALASGFKGDPQLVFCVRGGMNADQY